MYYCCVKKSSRDIKYEMIPPYTIGQGLFRCEQGYLGLVQDLIHNLHVDVHTGMEWRCKLTDEV